LEQQYSASHEYSKIILVHFEEYSKQDKAIPQYALNGIFHPCKLHNQAPRGLLIKIFDWCPWNQLA
jgi:hypothetical protein